MLEIDEDQYGTYIMNARDLCLAEYLPELLDAGVCSLKVEGRSKTIYYAGITARAYRIALDAIESGTYDDRAKEAVLNEVFTTNNRGYIPGFLVGNPKEKAQEYEERQGFATHEFAGVVRKRKGNTLTIECRNRFDLGEELQFCFPNIADDFSLFHQKFVMKKEKSSLIFLEDRENSSSIFLQNRLKSSIKILEKAKFFA